MKMTHFKTVWLLINSESNAVEQLHGITNYMKNTTVIEKDLLYTRWKFLPNWMQKYFKPAITEETKQTLLNKKAPDVILSIGRRTAVVSWWLGCFYPKAYRVHLFNPKLSFKYFDRIALPLHDRMSQNKKVIPYYGETHSLTKDQIIKSKEIWRKKFANLPSPKIAILVGGSFPKSPFTFQDSMTLSGKLRLIKKKNPKSSLLIATSKKTGRKQTLILRKGIKSDFFYTPKDNRAMIYHGILAWADKIILVNPTVIALSRAASLHKPLYIYTPERIVDKKSRRESKVSIFRDMLFEMGIAKPFNPSLEEFQQTKFPNCTKEIAQLIDADLMIREASNSA
ncbi:MAG: ELM1/GtrOC1 family putative glycosyltransferase [Alphaproteobacteria bacterium]